VTMMPKMLSSRSVAGDAAALSRYAATGDPMAFEALTARYQDMVFATCLRVLRRGADAEDAAQETFLKLARNASKIRGNVSAWLHACAMGTATDMLRARASRYRAEDAARSGLEQGALESPEDTRAWRELEPLLDAALAELPEEERDAVVGHFLCGRSQKDIAQDARVSPGTISRRIEKGLATLAQAMKASGLALAGAATLATALHAVAEVSRSTPQLSASLSKVALAGTALTERTAAASLSFGAKSAAVILSAAAVAGGAMLINYAGPWFSRQVPGAVAGTPPVLERPSSTRTFEITNYTLDGAVDANHLVDITTERFTVTAGAGSPEATKGFVLKIDSHTHEGTSGRMTLSFESSTIERVGEEIIGGVTIRYNLRGDVLDMNLTSKAKGDTIVWLCKRAPATDAATKTDADNPIIGSWFGLDRWKLSWKDDDLMILSDNDFLMRKFRILSWKPGPDWVQAEAICAKSAMDSSVVGSRVKMLLRNTAEGIEMAYYDFKSPRSGQWPDGFEPKPGTQLRVFSWRAR
jgi:RNA polymerase sigma factor (sigma-70 family)